MMDCSSEASVDAVVEAGKDQLDITSTANRHEGGNKYVSTQSYSSENGTKWTSNGKSPDHSAITSDSERDSFGASDRNQCVKEAREVGIAGLPGDLTTPPLTPPREEHSKHPVATSEPVNGNRNNVSDSVHANSSSFKTTVNVGVSNGIASREQESETLDRQDTGSPSNLDMEPPALVIISDAEENREEGEEEEAMDASSEPEKDFSSKSSNCNGDALSHQIYVKASSLGGCNGKEVSGSAMTSLQSAKMTTGGKDAVSSGEDELLEEADMEANAEDESMAAQRADVPGRPAHFTTNSSAGVSHPHPNASLGDAKVDLSAAKNASLPSHKACHPSAVDVTKKHPKNGHTPSSVYVAERKLRENRGHQDSGGFQDHNRREREVESPALVTNVKQAAKVKQFFTTIQQHANKLGSEVAEQVQELIHALMNETASVEEFHQEIQTIMNYPLKDFIIPFLRDNIGYLRAELKESSQVLSDVLCEVSTSSAVSLTPQLVDDDLPVLPSSTNKSSTLPSIRTVNSSTIHSSSSTSAQHASKTSTTSSSIRISNPHSSSSNPHSSSSLSSSSSYSSSSSVQSHIHSGSGSTQAHSHAVNHVHGAGPTIQSHSHVDDGMEVTGSPRVGGGGSKQMLVRSVATGVKRRRWSNEHGPSVMTVEKDKEGGTEKTWKRVRTGDVSDGTAAAVIISNPRQLPPSYHHPPPPPPPTTHIVAASTAQPSPSTDSHVVYSSFPQETPPRRRGNTLSEDWGHIDMMLSSIQGMVEKTRQSMAVLKERVSTTHMEMERREMERDSIIQQRVSEAVDKIKLQSTEEKQRMLLEASKQLREAVASVKAEMEGKMQQTQALAVQEALKEANVQSSSKENCWNCGRRATETCSGCNKARYCGTFCQHKDWANHMHHCASGVQGQAEEVVTHEPKRVHHHTLSAGDVTLTSSARGLPVVASPHHRTMAIPVNLIGGSAAQEVNVRLAPVAHSTQGHPDIIIKTERT